jgi:hypothetical protein
MPRDVYGHYVTEQDYIRAELIGVNKKNVDQRIYLYGYTVEKAVTTPLRKDLPKKEVVKVVSKMPNDYYTYLEIAKVNDIPRHVYYNRYVDGWDPILASSTPVGKRCKREKRG